MSPKTSDVLPLQRALFDLPPDVTFLNCATMAPQLRAATEAGMAAVRQKAQPWALTGDNWFSAAEELRSAVARLMETDADGVALVPAASYGIAVAAANLPLGRGENVVVLHEQFPSNVYAWRELAQARGAELRTVRKAPADDWTEAVLESMDDATAIVAVPNCHWTDGALVDLVPVGERARALGAALVVDASQSLGARPLDIDAVKPDFLVTVGYKWLLGPYSLGYLYAAPRWREQGKPLEASWATRAGAENFAALGYVDDYRPGARRYDMGEFAQFVLAPIAHAGIRQLLEWRVERIQATLRRLTDRLATEAGALGCDVLERGRRADHMLGIRFRGGIPPELPQRLDEARVFVGVRGDAIRVSPHVYNGEEDIDRLVSALRRSA